MGVVRVLDVGPSAGVTKEGQFIGHAAEHGSELVLEQLENPGTLHGRAGTVQLVLKEHGRHILLHCLSFVCTVKATATHDSNPMYIHAWQSWETLEYQRLTETCDRLMCSLCDTMFRNSQCATDRIEALVLCRDRGPGAMS